LDSAFQPPEETPFLTGEQFPELGEDIFAAEEESELGAVFAAPPPPGAPSETDLRSLFEFHAEPGTVDEGVEATREEKAARRHERGGRLLGLTVGALFLVVVAVILVAVVTLGGSSAKADPGPLKVVTVESENVQSAVSGAKAELASTGLGLEEQVIVAESALGQTLFIEFCAQPTPDLPQLITQGMDIAARQARTVADALPAIGVSVDLCGDETRDNLYRAFVSTADATRYVDGDLGQGEVGAASFQALWRTS
jgi:hypothetical protein